MIFGKKSNIYIFSYLILIFFLSLLFTFVYSFYQTGILEKNFIDEDEKVNNELKKLKNQILISDNFYNKTYEKNNDFLIELKNKSIEINHLINDKNHNFKYELPKKFCENKDILEEKTYIIYNNLTCIKLI